MDNRDITDFVTIMDCDVPMRGKPSGAPVVISQNEMAGTGNLREEGRERSEDVRRFALGSMEEVTRDDEVARTVVLDEGDHALRVALRIALRNRDPTGSEGGRLAEVRVG